MVGNWVRSYDRTRVRNIVLLPDVLRLAANSLACNSRWSKECICSLCVDQPLSFKSGYSILSLFRSDTIRMNSLSPRSGLLMEKPVNIGLLVEWRIMRELREQQGRHQEVESYEAT